YALRLTFFTSLIMVVVNIISGTATAWVMVRYNFPLKNIINSLIDLPFAIPTVVTGIMLVSLYGPNSVVGAFLGERGFEIMFAKPGIVLALLYVTFPFVVRTVQPVLMEMDLDMEEAAKTLGASNVKTFLRVTIPTLLPAILTGAALSFSRAMGEFGSIAIVAGNIPFKTQVASVYIYGELESYNQQGALGLSLVLLLCSFFVLVFLNLLQIWSRRHEKFK
ncbi:MAG: sulfate ABC transporter permease subunit CysT, partial [bacterium]|nr:sulfate ABC transporter permease subunit CysT [bacterium]